MWPGLKVGSTLKIQATKQQNTDWQHIKLPRNKRARTMASASIVMGTIFLESTRMHHG
jgi:hypothetical protein